MIINCYFRQNRWLYSEVLTLGKSFWTFNVDFITETSPCAIGNFRKWLLYKCFMNFSLIVIQINIKFLKITVIFGRN